MIITKEWIRAALVRALKTVAQTAVALIGTQAVGILDVDWVAVLSASTLAGIISILTSIAGLPEVPDGSKLQSTVNVEKMEKMNDFAEVEDYEETDYAAEE